MGDDREEPSTEELRLSQLRREREEREQAGRAADDTESEKWSRRAEKSAYLRERLEERERAEREAAGEDDAGR